MAKLQVAVLFGGASSEHEVSRVSAAAVAEGISAEKYDVLTVGITKKGQWFLYSGPTVNMRDGSWEQHPSCVPAVLSADSGVHGLVIFDNAGVQTKYIDIVFPVLHGRNGEDGTIQGLLQMAGIPYVGCGILGSALCMDKITSNRTFDEAGIAQTEWLAVKSRDAAKVEEIDAKIAEKLGYPVFVKPSVGGSSVGISKVKSKADLAEALTLAAEHDVNILIERAIIGQEVECAVLGNQELFASLPGEVVSANDEMYDYEAKYQSGDASMLYLPAHLPQAKLEEVRDAALRAYEAAGCQGLARVDFFVEKETGRVLLNEINTMPGFTPISMYPKLMEMSGLPMQALTEKLLSLALERTVG